MNDKKADSTPRRYPFDVGAIPITGVASAPPPEAAAADFESTPVPKAPREEAAYPPPKSTGRKGRAKYSWALRPWPSILAMIGLLLSYLLLSQLFVALFLPRLLADRWGKSLERSVTIARAEWQPLALVLTLHNGIVGPRLADPHDRIDPLLSFRSLRADLRPTALFHSGPLLKELHLEQPFLHLLRDQDGSYNLPWPGPAAGRSGWWPREVKISNGRLLYTDRSNSFPTQPEGNRREFRGEVREINGGWRLDPANDPGGLLALDLRATGPEAAAIGLQGRLALGSSTTAGDLELTVQGLPLTALAHYLHPLLAQEIDGGRLTIQARFHPGPGPELHIDQRVELEELRLGSKLEHHREERSPQLLQALLSGRDHIVRLDLPLKIQTQRRDSPYLRELAAALDSRLEQAALTPLSLLAAKYADLVKRIDFPAGGAELSREAGRNLDLLAAALGDRPLLRLEIGGVAVFACDREVLQLRREKMMAEQRRQAVATLAREMAAGGEITVTAEQIGSLRPENVVTGEPELLELAAARQQVVRRRLAMALGIENGDSANLPATAPSRLFTSPPAVQQHQVQTGSGCGTATLKFKP